MSDILVIGGGIIGLLTARELVQAGAAVTLVELGETGRESSWAGGGIVSPLYPWRYPDSVTALARWSQRLYPKLCAELTAETGIDPELTVNGLLILDPQEREPALVCWAATHGTEVQLIDSVQLHEAAPELAVRPPTAMLLPAVANVRNPRLVKAARRALAGRIALREQEEVHAILAADGRVEGVRTSRGLIRADQVVVCTGAWTARLLDPLGQRPDIAPVRGQMLLFKGRPGQVNYTTLWREHYVIPRRDGRVLVGSTLEQTGFVKETTAQGRESLQRAAVELYPLLAHTPIEAHWSGLRPGAPGGIPYIAPVPGTAGLYVNAGHYRNGIVTGPASARLVADLLLGRDPVTDPAPYALDVPRLPDVGAGAPRLRSGR
ncbi:glycine oxidase ThiO [uncultured Thiodictyon sp.]|jgi:glycine oxidase|uniref:glycine oxidase ThiO n=1 Tax=uncultured Thiodictyon sp. TaxID=1846217 RepID=UPI0025F064C8|nr:glycine oxidase ThiO [uncultured Thiodictyon sp.]